MLGYSLFQSDKDIFYMELTNYKERIERLYDLMDEGIAIVPSAKYVQRSNDTDYPFWQNSNFKYLTGINEPDCVLVLSKTHEKKETTLFIRENNSVEEMWMGKRLGLEKGREIIDADNSFSISELEVKLRELIPGHDNLFIHFHERADIFEMVRKITGELFYQKRKADKLPPRNFKNAALLIERLRLVKDQNEILTMKKAMIATSKAHQAAMALATPGKNEKEVTALLDYFFTKDASQGRAYDNIVAGGNNANILHYIENNSTLNDGDLLLIDAGSHLNNYATDITRTFPVNGKFSEIQKDVYSIVLEAQKAAMSHVFEGRTQNELHLACSKVLATGLKELKVLDQGLDEILEKSLHRKYFPHGTGHWIGLDVHDQCPYFESANEYVKFEKGMVFTIEPGLYFPKEDDSIREELKGIGIRIEDNILVTEKGHENLSSMIPKEIKEVEDACQKDILSFY